MLAMAPLLPWIEQKPTAKGAALTRRLQDRQPTFPDAAFVAPVGVMCMTPTAFAANPRFLHFRCAPIAVQAFGARWGSFTTVMGGASTCAMGLTRNFLRLGIGVDGGVVSELDPGRESRIEYRFGHRTSCVVSLSADASMESS